MLDSPLFAVFGRLHPMVLHLPIGMLVALGVLEVFARLRRKAVAREARVTLAWLAAGFAAVSVVSGLQLSRETAYTHDGVWLHQWLGIATGVLTVVCALMTHARAPAWAYFGTLVVAIGVMIPAGHFGAGMTHGDNFVLEPLAAKGEGGGRRGEGQRTDTPVAPPVNAPGVPVLDPAIAAIFKANCIGCHNAERLKGGLALDTAEGLRNGGDGGAVVVAGKPQSSEMMIRLNLTPGDKEHMPPPGKKPLSAAEVETIRKWIETGASGLGDPAMP